MIRATVLLGLMFLGGCAGIPVGVLYGFQAAASVATIARDVFDMDVSWTQTHPDKTPLRAILP